MKSTNVFNKFIVLISFILLGIGLQGNGQTMMPIPPGNSTYVGDVRGFYFISPVSFTMTGLRVPSEAGTGTQSFQVMKIHSGGVAIYTTMGTNFTTLFYANNVPNNTIQTVNISVNAGDTIGILGQAGTTTSYSASMTPSYSTTISGAPVELTRFMYQGAINSTAALEYTSITGGSIGRVEMYYAAATPCSGQPTAGTVPATIAVCPSIPFSITATGATLGSSMINQWQSRNPAGTGTWTDIGGATTPIYSSPGITSPTDYRYLTTCTPSALSDTSTIVTTTINPGNQCYCIPSNTSSASYYISDFSTTGGVTNITNNNTGFSPTGYGDYSATDTVSAMQGDDVMVSVSSMLSSSYSYDVWVDWDQDGNFNGANEHVLTTNGTYVTGAYNGTITVPINALPGNTRMRVRNAYLSSPAPVCGTHDYGEAEDYTFTVLVSCTNPVVDLGADTSFCAGQTLTLDAGNAGLVFLWNDNSTNQTLIVNAAGTYSVTVTDGQCSTSDTILVSMDPLPSADSIDAVNSGVCDFTFRAINAQNVTSYSWTFGDGSPNDTNPIATHAYAQNGSYLAVLTMTNDCGTKTITTTVNCTGVGINDIDLSKDALKLYPNPTSDKITIENSSNLNMEYITVFNVLGQVVYQSVPQNAVKHQMNVSNLASGLYTVRIKTNEGMVIRKFEILK